MRSMPWCCVGNTLFHIEPMSLGLQSERCSPGFAVATHVPQKSETQFATAVLNKVQISMPWDALSPGKFQKLHPKKQEGSGLENINLRLWVIELNTDILQRYSKESVLQQDILLARLCSPMEVAMESFVGENKKGHGIWLNCAKRRRQSPIKKNS